MISYQKFIELSYDKKKETLFYVFETLTKKFNIQNDDFLFLLKNFKEIKEETLDDCYKKLCNLKEKGRDTYYIELQIKNTELELKNEITDK